MTNGSNDLENDINECSVETLGGAFAIDMQDFPVLPYSITQTQTLYDLGVKTNSFSLITQRNFWVYMFLECDSDTYEKFKELHNYEIREKVCPTC